MKDLQREIDTVVPSIDVESINKENLKKIRNESTNKSKIDWYSLRKIYEIQFNKKIIENKNIVIDIEEKTRKEKADLETSIETKYKNIDSLRSKISELKERISLVGVKNLKNAEVLQELIREKRNLLSTVGAELELEKSTLESQNIENSAIDKRIDKLKAEINSLKKNLSIKNVSESQLDELKELISRYRKIFKLSILKLSKHGITIDINSNVISIDFNSSLESTRISIKETNEDPFSQFYCSIISHLPNIKLSELLRRIVEIFLSVQAIKKEIENLRQLYRIEYFYLNSKIYFRIFLECTPLSHNIFLDSKFNFYIDDELYCNVLDIAGSISNSITYGVLNIGRNNN